jgi:hypothetical protein
MNPSQKRVAIGAGSGVLSMVLLVTVLSMTLAAPQDVGALAERIAYALRWNVIAAVPFFVMVVSVANSRFLSDAIDPLAQKETLAQTVNGRVTDNTLQQNFLFLVATLALSTVLSEARLQIIPAMTIVFVIARVVFWIGYRKDPLLRAPGMAATAYLNLGGLLAAAWLAFVAT